MELYLHSFLCLHGRNAYQHDSYCVDQRKVYGWAEGLKRYLAYSDERYGWPSTAAMGKVTGISRAYPEGPKARMDKITSEMYI
jgi:hypothetical protein